VVNRSNSIVTFQQSLERVMRKPGFLDAFYTHFVGQSEEIAGFFEHRDMEALKRKLNNTLLTLVEVAEGRPGAKLYAEMLGRIHTRLDVEERHLGMWTDALLDTVARFDDAYGPQVATAWKSMIEKIIARMYPGRESGPESR
jgi:hemoglobin-like flavoprotein